MATQTFSKSGTKATTDAKLPKSVFSIEVKNHQLLKDAYVAYLSNGRRNLAKTLKRGEVRGGGKKPWKQKGTGRARFGSIRTPLWRGGGIIFGPTGAENYSKKLNLTSKRLAIRQALSLANQENKIIIIESFENKEGKVKHTTNLLQKIGVTGKALMVLEVKDEMTQRATRNLSDIKVVQANYLNVYDILNADSIIIDQNSLKVIKQWLGDVNE